MDREQEEALLHITVEYVAEERAGNLPHLSEYLARYPQYADAISEFVTYYHAIETLLPEPGEEIIMPPFSQRSQIASKRAWKRILQAEPTVPLSNGLLTKLLIAANKSHLTFAQLATQIGLSQDILEKLDQQRIKLSTLPQEVLKRLANVLQQPLNVLQSNIGLSNRREGVYGVAEPKALYAVEEDQQPHLQSFREAIEQSPQLSEEQKRVWRNILAREDV